MRWIAATAALGVLLVSSPASAHTEPDLVAVPANSQSTITLQPTHGCGDSPTVQVRIRAPMEGAVAEPVDGWTASSTPDGAGNTVLEWAGGPLPADTDGAFPVSFIAPDAPGLLLTFPAIQVCASGEELAWIDGNPQGEYPAPRVLVLPVGYEPAETIDDVPLDAPGRQQLVEVVDVDNPQATTTSAPAAPTTAAPTTVPPAPTTVATTAGARRRRQRRRHPPPPEQLPARRRPSPPTTAPAGARRSSPPASWGWWPPAAPAPCWSPAAAAPTETDDESRPDVAAESTKNRVGGDTRVRRGSARRRAASAPGPDPAPRPAGGRTASCGRRGCP